MTETLRPFQRRFIAAVECTDYDTIARFSIPRGNGKKLDSSAPNRARLDAFRCFVRGRSRRCAGIRES